MGLKLNVPSKSQFYLKVKYVKFNCFNVAVSYGLINTLSLLMRLFLSMNLQKMPIKSPKNIYIKYIYQMSYTNNIFKNKNKIILVITLFFL